jgi:scyllo-inositol 2-dehydrogenase (NADP+)
MAGEPLRVGIAGLGRSGWAIHACAMRKVPELFKIVAVFDPDAGRRQEAQDACGARGHASFEELLKDREVEIQVVATPSKFHVEHALAAFAGGKHVVCEKPMATNLPDAERLVAAAAKAKTVFAVFQNRRFAPDFMKVQEVIRSGVLGEIKLINMRMNGFGRRWDWQTLKKNGGGTLNNTGPHMLDQALQLFGDEEPREVFADLQRMLTSGDAEDHVKIVIRAPGRPVLDVECSSGVAYPGDAWTVSGTRGGLRGSASELHWKCFDPRKYPAPPVDERPTPDRSYNRLPMEFKEESWKVPEQDEGADLRFYRALHATLRGGAAFPIKAESILRQMRLIARAKELSPV